MKTVRCYRAVQADRTSRCLCRSVVMTRPPPPPPHPPPPLRRPLGHKKDVKLKLLEKQQANPTGVHSMQRENEGWSSLQRLHSNDDTHNSAHCKWGVPLGIFPLGLIHWAYSHSTYKRPPELSTPPHRPTLPELRSCVKVEVDVPNKPPVSVDVKQHFNNNN